MVSDDCSAGYELTSKLAVADQFKLLKINNGRFDHRVDNEANNSTYNSHNANQIVDHITEDDFTGEIKRELDPSRITDEPSARRVNVV